MKKIKLDNSKSFFEDAKKLHPGGVLGIRRPANFVEGEYPIFITKGKGCRVTDIDNNEYIDMLCSYGPIIIGHREEKIDSAVIKQIQEKGFCFSLTQPINIQLSKLLIDRIPSCEMAIFVKTGSDATSAAIRAARSYTGKNKILRCGYHGWHDWCVENSNGVTKNITSEILEFKYNDLSRLEKHIKNNMNDIAGLIITPIGHPLGKNVEMPNKNYLEDIREITRKNNIVLIFDEIRTGFRTSIGGAQKLFNVTPDLSTFGKAMANGYDIAALVGKKEIMEVYNEKAFISSTYFENSLAMVASIETINFLEENKVLENISEKGKYFENKVNKFIHEYENICELSGCPWMPFINFKNGIKKKLLRNEFYKNLINKKIFSHPYHHSYICFRHSYEDLDYVINAIEEGFKDIKKLI